MTAFRTESGAPGIRGFFIAVEGLDGAGKTTLAKALCALLAARGFDPLYVKEPGDSQWGRQIREIAQNGRDGLDPADEMRLFVLDRAEDVAKNIAPALAAGRPVVADRYIASNVAYQSILGLPTEEILKANAEFPWPDLTILLENPVELGLSRIARGRAGGANQGFEGADYLGRVKAVFDRLDLPGLVRLNAHNAPAGLLRRSVELMEAAGFLKPLRIIDSHCHLTSGGYDNDFEEVLERARAAGVTDILDVALDCAGARRALAAAEKYPMLRPVLGWHPHEASLLTGKDLAELALLAKNPKVVGFGEIGLDYHYDHSPRDVQRQAFEALLEVAAGTKLPVVIHSREAFDDTFSMLKEHRASLAGGLIHCFTGSWAEAERYLDLGFYISLPGVITFPKGAEMREAAARCPADRLMVETDAPYLSPIPFRGKRNEPSYLLYHLRAVAEARGVSLEDAAELCSRNTQRLFNL